MMETIEVKNHLGVDWCWDEQECRAPSKARLKRERHAWEEAERNDRKDVISSGIVGF